MRSTLGPAGRRKQHHLLWAARDREEDQVRVAHLPLVRLGCACPFVLSDAAIESQSEQLLAVTRRVVAHPVVEDHDLGPISWPARTTDG